MWEERKLRKKVRRLEADRVDGAELLLWVGRQPLQGGCLLQLPEGWHHQNNSLQNGG